MQKISKREILNLIKQYNINEASMEQTDASIKVYIEFGNQTMNKQPTIRELILNISSEVKEMKLEIKQINGRLDKIEERLDKIEVRLDYVEKDVKDIKVRLDKIENCPTIKKEICL